MIEEIKDIFTKHTQCELPSIVKKLEKVIDMRNEKKKVLETAFKLAEVQK